MDNSDFWKLPPRAKIAEALGAVADSRVELEAARARVRSSDGAKTYQVQWRDNVYRSDDNGSKWQGYTGYPIVAVLMLRGQLPYDPEIANVFAAVDWTARNKAAKRDYDAVVAAVIAERGADASRVEAEIDRIYTALGKLQLPRRAGVVPPAEAAEAAAPVEEITLPPEGRLDWGRLGSAEAVAVAVDGDWTHIAIATLQESFYVDLSQADEDFLTRFFGSGIRKTGHGIKDLIRKLMERGIATGGWVFDTALGCYLLEPEKGEQTIQAAALAHLNRRVSGNLRECAAAIAQLTPMLDAKMETLGMRRLYVQAELPLATVLASMEHIGVALDQVGLAAYGEKLAAMQQEAQTRVYQAAGRTFNINSPKQLGALLFDELKLPTGKKTKSGYSTDVDILEKLREAHPVVSPVLEFRKIAKLKSTYADGLLAAVAPDGRLHSSFNMMATATGRLSSAEPNLQNLPIRSELGGEIRKMITATPPDWVLVDADYSQIELRLLAHIAGDEAMRAAFRAGEDIHAVTASQVFGVPLAEVSGEMRRRAKAVNFGIVYGISRFALAEDIGVSRKEADDYMNAYFAKYAGVRRYMDEIVERAKRDGYVATMWGRRRYLPELQSPNFNVRSFGERVALNAPIQGTAADIMKAAMVKVFRRLRDGGYRAKLVLQIHDELILDAPPEEVEQVRCLLKEEMEGAAALSVPLAVETSIGKNWFEAK